MVLKHYNRRLTAFVQRQRMTKEYELLNKYSSYDNDKIPNEEFLRNILSVGLLFRYRYMRF